MCCNVRNGGKAMAMKRSIKMLCLSIFAVFGMVQVACGVTISNWVTIGDAGNVGASNDKRPGAGAVSYEYRIMSTQITVSQYVEFLNAVAKDDPHHLYISNMGGTAPDGTASSYSQYCNVGQIARSGSAGSYSYSVIGNAGNQPVAYMSFEVLARFANWLHNGQPVGAQDASTTEDGAYDMSITSNLVHKPGAKYWVPTDDELVKAAYYDGNGHYYDFGDAHNYPPYPSADVPANDTGHTANYNYTGPGTAPGYITDAGAYASSKSHYGLFDIDGTLMDITETEVATGQKTMRGSAWNVANSYAYRPGTLQKTNSYGTRYSYTGGRLASRVPEPATIGLMAMGLYGLMSKKR